MANPIAKLFTLGEGKHLKKFEGLVGRINELEPALLEKTDEELRAASDELRTRAQNGEENAKLLPESFALMREASRRTIGLRHYDVQLIGGMALNDGCIAEMKTGEGKTLVSTAAGYLNALDGSNCHIVTVNDYLARRDAEWMGQVYAFLGMKVGLIQNGMQPFERKPEYEAAVTYGTNSEFGFDYLRDNMVGSAADRVQRGHTFCVVDEVDSILIDEARTPLIISGLGGGANDIYNTFAHFVPMLDKEEDIVLDEVRHTVYPTEEGLDKLEELMGIDIYADVSGTLANHLKQALRAEFLFQLNKQYVVIDGELKIVDEFTGRIMEGRRFSEGLHQALEAKEHVEIKAETHTLATVTLQNYFRLYKKLSGMTGTALTEDSEFKTIYKLPVIPIPTNKPVIRKDEDDYIFRTLDDKYNAVVDEVERRHEKGQPVLVGTSSIAGSERLSAMMDERGIPHETLNAKNPEREARIVAQAGRLGAVTIATNMAGRGTDILLGGNFEALRKDALAKYGVDDETAVEWQRHSAEAEARYITDREGYAVRLFGGLLVIGTDRHESRRIDNQLRGRSGRQGDPGESRFYLSLEDDLLRLFGGDRLKRVDAMMKQRDLGGKEPLQDALVSKVIGAAQQKVESMHFAARKSVLEYDDVMNLQRKAIYKERNAILDGKDVVELAETYAEALVEEILKTTCPEKLPSDDWDFYALDAWVESMTGLANWKAEELDHEEDPAVLLDLIVGLFMGIFDEKADHMGEVEFGNLCQQVMLRMIDTHWIDHLMEMDYVRAGIGLRAVGHRDPLVEYKDEAYSNFEYLTSSIYEDFLRAILRMPVEEEAAPAVLDEKDNPFNFSKMIYNDGASANEAFHDDDISRDETNATDVF